ncbi:hypothetical protein [Stenomitos frigidus]|uniref:Uncharacterized protein n=1 Tax=Stenomitos frigidus ULC18 TaxID=2107698 RepID=A0A2T1EMJ0_9CYAN|nr:hypothetical protein [Stenomitos frigidus]PSB33931.1 hypothetical protein C7B82_03450 [Stenomitos frigidus ULC18]
MYALQNSSSNYADLPVLLHNREAWKQLEQERERLTNGCRGAGISFLAGLTLANPILLLGSLPLLGITGTQLQKTSQIYLNMGRLLDAFERQEIIITPRLEVPDNGSLDLFVRFPNPPKAVFTIGLRSNGESTIFFNEQKEGLCLRRKRGGFKTWQVDLFRRFALQEFWLRKNRQDLFGQSSRDKNRPAVKLLVLTGKTKLGKHSEHLYAMIGDQKVLSVRNRVSLFIMEEEQLIPFIKAWLAKADNPNNG